MNTLAHIGGTVALFWIAFEFCLSTLGQTQLGFAVLAMAILFGIPLTFVAIADDIQGWRDRFKRG